MPLLFHRHYRNVYLVSDCRREDHIAIVAAEARVRVDVIITAGVVRTFGVFGQDDNLVGVAVQKMGSFR
jgi:hypothetical protein